MENTTKNIRVVDLGKSSSVSLGEEDTSSSSSSSSTDQSSSSTSSSDQSSSSASSSDQSSSSSSDQSSSTTDLSSASTEKEDQSMEEEKPSEDQPSEDQPTEEDVELQQEQPTEEVPEKEAEEPESNPDKDLDAEKLNMFYYLKNKYELDKKERCNKFALGKENVSWKIKRAYFASKKPKCINCKRKVGSLFTIKYEEEFRKFLGKCGDTEKPCEFHIEFKMPKTIRVDKEYNNLLRKLNELQESIVVTKNKVIFGMLDPATAVTQFDELKNEITERTAELEKYSTQLLNVTYNLEKKEEISAKMAEFNENVAELNLIIQKYLLEDEPIKTAVDYFIDTIDVSSKYLAKLKYADREVELVKNAQGMLIDCRYHTFDYLLAELELPTVMEVVEYNLGESNTAPPELSELDVTPGKREKMPTTNKTRKVRQVKAKNKTVRNLDNQDDLNDVMQKILQNIIMENRLTITRREIYELIEDQYHVTDVRGKYGNVIKEYFQKNLALWMQVYPDIMDLAYVMAQNKTIQDTTVSKFIAELNQTHPDIDFSPFNKVIKETLVKYVTLLNRLSSSGDAIPRPDWPTAP